MKKCTVLKLMVTASFTIFSDGYTADTFPLVSRDSIQFQNDNLVMDGHVRVRFNRERFFTDYNQEFSASLGMLSIPGEQTDQSINSACWQALFRLKDHYKNKEDKVNYGFTYLNMAKILLSHNAYPDSCQTDFQKKEFYHQLRDKIGLEIIPAIAEDSKLKKWAYIYVGMLFLEYVRQFPSTHNREKFLKSAYFEFSRAMDIKTTKTSYLLAAETILDFGFVPKDMTQEQANARAYEFIEKAYAKTNRQPSDNKSDQVRSIVSMVEKHARPTYMRELNKEPDHEGISNGEEASHSTDERMAADNFSISEYDAGIRDELHDYNYDNLEIRLHPNPLALPIRNRAMNKEGMLQESYEIDGQRFKRQNVSGVGLNCFFNAMGLHREGQIYQLKFFVDDPVMRFMIANEIISATHNPEQLSDQLKRTIHYQAYATQRGELDVLQQERNQVLHQQSFDPNLDLPECYQNLRQRDDVLLDDLRRRALQREAYETFVDYDISGEQMMVTLFDLNNNLNGNFTSIDAIAYANQIGIKIYQPAEEGVLRLIHQYVPENANEIVYLYHSGVHFQALVPVTSEPLVVMDRDLITSSGEERSLESNAIAIPSEQELLRLYPDVMLKCRNKVFDGIVVRKVIYLRDKLGLEIPVISTVIPLDRRRLSDILVANNLGQFKRMESELLEDLISAYLQHYSDLQSGLMSYVDFARSFEKQKGGTENSILQRIKIGFKKGGEVEAPEFIDEKKSDVIKMYQEGFSFCAIRYEVNLSIETIVRIIYEGILPESYRERIDLAVEKESLSVKEKRELVIATFHKLKDQTGKNPSVLGVSQSLKDQGIGYKQVQKILKEEGLVAKNIKSKHLSDAQKDAIRNDFAQINPQQGEISCTYKHLARKHDATLIQVQDLLKDRTYGSDRQLEIQKNRELVIAAYHQLTPEQQKKPLQHILKSVSLSTGAIRSHLVKAGLYPDVKSVTEESHEQAKISHRKDKKRAREAFELDEENLPSSKKRKTKE